MPEPVTATAGYYIHYKSYDSQGGYWTVTPEGPYTDINKAREIAQRMQANTGKHRAVRLVLRTETELPILDCTDHRLEIAGLRRNIDGQTVYFTEDPEWHGTVLGNDTNPDWVRVQWQTPTTCIAAHPTNSLTTYTLPPELTQLIYRQGRELNLLRHFLLKMPVDLKTQLLVYDKLDEALRIAKGLQ